MQFSYSKRLNFIADFISPCTTLADIGTDHAYVPIRLIKTGKIKYAIACDINKGPLNRSMENISRYDLGSYIQTRLSDGMSKLKYGEADTVLIAGMGAQLMMRILDGGEEIRDSINEYVLSPQSEWREFRIYLDKKGYSIKDEGMVYDQGKYYLVIKASAVSVKQSKMHETCKSNVNLCTYQKNLCSEYNITDISLFGEASDIDEAYRHFGYYLIKKNNAVLKEYLKKEYNTYIALFNKLSAKMNNTYSLDIYKDDNLYNRDIKADNIDFKINKIKKYINLIKTTERIMR